MSARAVKTIATLVALVALGVGGYIWWDRTRVVYISETITRWDDSLGAHLLLPNLSNAEVTVIDRPHEPSENMAEDRFETVKRLRVFHVSTNSMGLRGPEMDNPKDKFRIVCVGDSVTFGWGVSYEESYPARLERSLADQGYDVEVVNAGVPAMKPATLADWVYREQELWVPDLVVVARRPDNSTPNPLKDYHSNIGGLIRHSEVPVVVVLPPVSMFDVKGVENWEAEYEWIKGQLNAPVFELTPAFRGEAEDMPGVHLEIGNDGSQRMLEMPGRRVLVDGGQGDQLDADIIQAFEDDLTLVEPLFFDGGHPTSEGFEFFADEVGAFLISSGALSAYRQ
jgi:hypothetical protein